MADRLLKVNAHTTLDLVDATVTGHDFEDDVFAVCNATSARESPDHVKLQFELDNMTEDDLPAHMDELRLTPEQARTLAAALTAEADAVSAARDE
ncbi:DUF6360 family protein [Haloarchaeobius sp. HRN-SO-5]|uniref:DUF6360 family protein n=1 Tax=Haloarchaeobius sp. HRN-SO-5 TaxID=3446118 RepID=UPI003EBCFF23